MARVMPKATVTSMDDFREYIHRCGEVVNIRVRGNQIVGYADISKVPVTTCPHCLQVIEFEDLQLMSNVENLGWPT